MNTLPGHRLRQQQWHTTTVRSAHGFTLIEILVVVLITGLLAAAASVSLLSRARSATMEDLVRRIGFLDSVTRHAAVRSGLPERLIVDLDQGRITAEQADETPSYQDESHWNQELRLPGKFKIDHFWLIDPQHSGAEDDHGPNEGITAPDAIGQTEGVVTLDCSTSGYTPSYALSITGPQADRRWILVSGLTGQVCLAADDKQVRSALTLPEAFLDH